jgi:hypothetical protein
MFNPASYKKGTVCLTYGDHPDTGWLGDLLLKKVVYPEIQHLQVRKFKSHPLYSERFLLNDQILTGKPFCKAVHAVIKTQSEGVDLWESCTVPKTVISPLGFTPNEKRCSFHYWNGLDYLNEAGWAAFDKVIKDTEGEDYDYPQLLGILIREQFGYLPVKLPLLQWSKKHMVCSVLCASACLAAFKATMGLPAELTSPRYPTVEEITPADWFFCKSVRVLDAYGMESLA